MTVRTTDLFDQDLLGEMVAGGYVRVQQHPDLPLSILNYTEKAQYERVWNPVTVLGADGSARYSVHAVVTEEIKEDGGE